MWTVGIPWFEWISLILRAPPCYFVLAYGLPTHVFPRGGMTFLCAHMSYLDCSAQHLNQLQQRESRSTKWLSGEPRSSEPAEEIHPQERAATKESALKGWGYVINTTRKCSIKIGQVTVTGRKTETVDCSVRVSHRPLVYRPRRVSFTLWWLQVPREDRHGLKMDLRESEVGTGETSWPPRDRILYYLPCFTSFFLFPVYILTLARLSETVDSSYTGWLHSYWNAIQLNVYAYFFFSF